MASGILPNVSSTSLAQSLLAQAQSSGSRGPGIRIDVLIWIGVLIVVAVLGGLLLVYLQKRMLKPPPAGPGPAGIMEELRRMRDSGAMTHEEFEATRKAMARKLSSGGESRRGPVAPPDAAIPTRARDDDADAGDDSNRGTD